MYAYIYVYTHLFMIFRILSVYVSYLSIHVYVPMYILDTYEKKILRT